MKTNCDLVITSSPACSPRYQIKVPAGAAVIHVAGQGGGYAVSRPQDYGANPHDAAHYYFWIAADAVEGT